jgi:HD-GYP domain-containing protein (c-di-GMP phosphodiesterase class II)
MSTSLPVHHRILAKGFLEHRPFGSWPNGEKIRDVSGVVVRANIEYLEEVIAGSRGAEAGRRAGEELCRRLNERIPDPTYHVTPAFLKNVWHSYSYEFAAFLGEFCLLLSGDPAFQFKMASEKFLPPLIQTLGRPFSVAQIYGMFPHFGEKFAKGSLHFEVVTVTEGSAVLRMGLAEHVTRQFGPYRRACALLICQASKAGLAAVPKQIHHMEPAVITDRACMADGDDSCEWEFKWTPQTRSEGMVRVAAPVAGLAAGGLLFAYLRVLHPDASLPEALALCLFPAGAAWLSMVVRRMARAAGRRERILQEQVQEQEQKHEALREAYLELEQSAVELNRAFEGFVQASITTIESRDPVTSGHSNRVAVLTCGLAEMVNRLETGPYAPVGFTAEQMQEIRYAALLHDFGKVGVREDVLLKAEKLHPIQLTKLRGRFALIRKSLELRALRHKLDLMTRGDERGRAARLTLVDLDLRRRLRETDDILAFVLRCNRPTVLAEGDFDRLAEIAALTYDAEDGPRPYLTTEEVESLSIRRGSLTPADRREIEGHVTATYRFLCAIPWSRALRNVPLFAYGHHEKLDGGGYPRGLAAQEIPLPTRMMTISDIYDALTAGDRPYKRAVPPGAALDILHDEARGGKLDGDLLEVFVEAKVYERTGRR